MATYRENGVLRRLAYHASQSLVIMAAQVVVVFTMTGLGMLLLVTAGKLVYHVCFEGNAFSMLGGFILSSLSFFGSDSSWRAPCPRLALLRSSPWCCCIRC